VDAFREKFEAVVSASIDPQLLIPEIVIDAELSLKDIRQNFYDILCQMEPFGPENLRPVFLARRLMNTGYCKIVKEEHIRFSLKEDQVTLTGIGFNMAKKFPLLEQKAPVDVVFTLDLNEWNDSKTLQLRVIDLRLSE